MSKRISFQGVDGAYSQLAVKDFFSGAETLPCKTFEIALNEAELGNVDYAMIPIENSAAGRVADIHRLIPKSNLHINFEHFQKVEHKLLIHPDSKIENIRNILSHEQALAQCSDKIQKLDLNILIGADTAGSAKIISDEKILDSNLKINKNVFHHIGVYAYHKKFLLDFISMPPSQRELDEKLEQLRIIDTNEIGISIVKEEILGVDTKEDLDRVNQLILKK